MKTTISHSKQRVAIPAALLSLATAFPCQLVAQATSDTEAVQLEEIVITGSNIPTAADIPVAPVTVIGADAISATGVSTNMLEVIRKSVPQFSGNANLGSSNGNIASGSTNGGAQVSLRNTATLVLVNGSRMSASPVAAVGGYSFVDLNMIPVSAVERVEVLTDGASAIYGADAVGGVVNIVLRKNFVGGETGARFAVTDNEGHYRERSAWASIGGADETKGRRWVVSYEWNKTDPIFNYQRAFATPAYGTTSFAGVVQIRDPGTSGAIANGYYYLDPALDAPRSGTTMEQKGYRYLGQGALDVLPLFNLAYATTMLLENERQAGTIAFEQRLTSALTAYGDVLFARTDTASQLNAQPVSLVMDADDVGNELAGIGVARLSVRNRFVDHPRRYVASTWSARVLAGLKADLGAGWSTDVAVNYNPSQQDFQNQNLVRTRERVAALADGSLKLFAREQDPAVLAKILGAARGEYESNRIALDFSVLGREVAKLPGGPIAVAFGGSVSQEDLIAKSDPDSQSETFAFDGGTTIDPFDKGRRTLAAFAEARVPIVGENNRIPGIHAMDLTVALRHENYDDLAKSPTVPKVALRYQPVGRSVVLRSTYSESFAAPTLYSLNAPPGFGFTPQLNQFGQNQAYLHATKPGDLTPSESKMLSAGFAWSPTQVKNLTLGVDYFRIKQSNLISNLYAAGVVSFVFADVEAKGAASAFADRLHIDNYDGPTISRPGQISELGLDRIYMVTPSAENIGGQELAGFDVSGGYRWSAGDGELALHTVATIWNKYAIQPVQGAPFQETAGKSTELNGTIPDWRGYTTLSYTRGALTALVGWTYYPSIEDAEYDPEADENGDYSKPYGPKLQAYSAWDVSVSYRFESNRRWLKGLLLTVGVNNITDEMPPLAVEENGNSNADVAEYNPIGRLYFGELRWSF